LARKIPKQVPPIAPIRHIIIITTTAGIPPAAIIAPILFTPDAIAFPVALTILTVVLTVLSTTFTVVFAACFVFFAVSTVLLAVFFVALTDFSAVLMLFEVLSKLFFVCLIFLASFLTVLIFCLSDPIFFIVHFSLAFGGDNFL